MFIYYVYAYLREDGSPYYIGKGKYLRAYDTRHGKIPVPKDHSRIVFLETNLSEVGALALERRYIRWYGRKDLGTGILRNLTNGGEGSNGMIGKSPSPETRAKMRLAKLGKPRPDEVKRKISASKIGKICSEETKQKHRINTTLMHQRRKALLNSA